MQLGLNGLGGGGLEIVLERCPIGQRKTVPVHHAAAVDVDLDDLGQHQRRRRIAGGHVEIDRVQLDRNGDDEHDQEHQHHVDQRRGVDVHHHLGIAGCGAGAYIHCHDAFLKKYSATSTYFTEI